MIAVAWMLEHRVVTHAGTDPIHTRGSRSGCGGGDAPPLPGSLLWRERKFLTLAAGMSLGVVRTDRPAHLFSLLLSALGVQWTGAVVGLIGVMAIAFNVIPGF